MNDHNSLDSALVAAVETACNERGQPPAVAKRLLAWMTQSSLGDLTPIENEQFFDSVSDTLNVPGVSDED